METSLYTQIIYQAYDAFNRRDIDAVLSLMTEDVLWPNGWEGGFVKGQEEVREYWTRQWKEINPMVTPVFISELPEHTFDVEVRQVIKDKNGAVISDSVVRHVYHFQDEKIKSMHIETHN